MLDLRKIDEEKMKVNIVYGNIPVFISGVMEMLESLALQKNIQIRFMHNHPDFSGYFDPDKMEKIITNILSNSIKFSGENTEIFIRLLPEFSASYYELRIEDKGIGIPEEQLEFIFKPFSQASNNSYGSGIGLALTREMVALQNGTITVKSKESKGSVFTIRLPYHKSEFEKLPHYIEKTNGKKMQYNNLYLNYLLEDSAPDLLDRTEKIAPQSINCETLLIIEDNHDLRNYVASIFNKNFRVFTAQNGMEGMKQVLKVMLDLIISDIMMPVMDGLAFCEKVKNDERSSHIPVILLTARSGEENILKGLECGADDYIVKPFNARELQVKVENVISGRQKLRERFSKELDIFEPKNITTSKSDEIFLEKAISIVEEHMQDPEFGSAELVEKLGMSRSLVFIKLKSLTGEGASNFIISVRMRHAARLLKENNKNISEVAFTVGFTDPAYFSRLFKKNFNKTPSAYLKT